MRVKIGEMATASKSFPVNIKWKCSKCMEDNEEKGYIEFSGTVSAYTIGDKERLKAQAFLFEDIREELPDVIQNPQDNYKQIKTGLRVNNEYCKGCRNRELWVKKYKIPNDKYYAFFITILIFGMIGLIIGLCKHIVPTMVFGGAVTLICSLFIFLRTSEGAKYRRLPKESLPHIEILPEQHILKNN